MGDNVHWKVKEEQIERGKKMLPELFDKKSEPLFPDDVGFGDYTDHDADLQPGISFGD